MSNSNFHTEIFSFECTALDSIEMGLDAKPHCYKSYKISVKGGIGFRMRSIHSLFTLYLCLFAYRDYSLIRLYYDLLKAN